MHTADDLDSFTGPIWKPMADAPADRHVDLWLSWGASPLTMGMADAFAVSDCWLDTGRWVHLHDGMPTELNRRYISAWCEVGQADETGPRTLLECIEAAASDLYDALRDALGTFVILNEEEDRTKWPRWVEKAEAALARARGDAQ